MSNGDIDLTKLYEGEASSIISEGGNMAKKKGKKKGKKSSGSISTGLKW